ncbi:hypothetical protein CI109_100084 [Kwoniella shandongensis]|uniref:D-isomer specific 2-hydroxyacid dehydrogenase NAD-binding domain-containing protein n=1 Tax=Kwoniella shandongensis TaxID=1734106 RepID=A0A5M6BNF9_9TREE|nr:uncharacterized protein CI109_007259 [Kwoniella shandongensis]KAA5524424.1 hypothetical protein CI109_007259 [Kwoniella shandongensis]
MAPHLDNLVITAPLSQEKLAEVKTHFKHVHHIPYPAPVPKDIAREADVWYSNYHGLPEDLTWEDVKRTKVVQLTSAGANKALESPALKNETARKHIAICSASGIHVLSIPQWIISQAISVYSRIYLQTFNLRTEQKWRRDIPQFPKSQGFTGQTLHGKTAGLLGYGHIARETARLLKAFNVKVIAANSSGERRDDDGYIIPGTGDKDGSIPSGYYSTNDPDSFNSFLQQTDILIASLPSTPQTTNLLKAEHLALLKKGAIFINVGRGDLVKTEVLLEALNDNLSGSALDVTDPEPLPDNHPLFTHPQVTITPHTSSDIAGYFEIGADLLLANVKRIREGGKPINKVDPAKGY